MVENKMLRNHTHENSSLGRKHIYVIVLSTDKLEERSHVSLPCDAQPL